MNDVWAAPHGLHVTLGAPVDAPALAGLHAAGFYRGWAQEDFEAYLREPRRTPVYVATDPRRSIAGFAVYKIVDEESELLTITVARRWRGKGVGAALMRASLDDLRHSPVRQVFLEVEEGNAPAERLYRAFGFVEIARRAAYYATPDGSMAAALVMRRDLG